RGGAEPGPGHRLAHCADGCPAHRRGRACARSSGPDRGYLSRSTGAVADHSCRARHWYDGLADCRAQPSEGARGVCTERNRIELVLISAALHRVALRATWSAAELVLLGPLGIQTLPDAGEVGQVGLVQPVEEQPA